MGMLIQKLIVILGMAVFIAMLFPLPELIKEATPLYQSGMANFIGRKLIAVIILCVPALLLLRYNDVLNRLSDYPKWPYVTLGIASILYMVATWPYYESYRFNEYDIEAVLRIVVLVSTVKILLCLQAQPAFKVGDAP